MNTLDLSKFVTTKAQALDFSARLAIVLEGLYKTDFQLDKALMEQFGLRKKDLFLSLMRDNQIQPESNTDLKEFFQTIQKQIASLPLLTLTLAFEPTEQTLKTLSEWFLLNLKKQVLFDITVDQKLIGGATITYNGKYQDYSIRPKVEAIIAGMLTPQTKAPTPAAAQETSPVQQPSPAPAVEQATVPSIPVQSFPTQPPVQQAVMGT